MNARGLPNLSALRAFEAAARRASFTAAAGELLVTPTAISHQIRQLEAQLGVRVLNRSPRAVSLTQEGRILYDAVTEGFVAIGRAVARLRDRAPAILTLSATTAFLSHWLVPRLAEVRRVLPALDLRLHAADAVVELKAGEVDAAIRYGKGPFAGVDATPLVRNAFAPVCSPALGIRDAGGLRRAALIHIEGRRAPVPAPDWRRWCRAAGIDGVDTEAGLRFTNGLHALQAAIGGQGVAIVSLVLVADALESGLLVQPFSTVLPGDTYHFACAPALAGRPDVAALRDWFRQSLA